VPLHVAAYRRGQEVAKIEPNLADHAADTQHRTGTAALLIAGLSLAVAVRGATWFVSYFLVGPILGLVDLLLPPDYKERFPAS
jgi:hypothetical protein